MALAVEVNRAAMIPSSYQSFSWLPNGFRVEWWLRISRAVQTFVLVRKHSFSPPSAAIVLKYIPHEKIMIRLGLDASVASFWLGVGFNLDKWRIELNTGMHPFLGITTGAGGGRIM